MGCGNKLTRVFRCFHSCSPLLKDTQLTQSIWSQRALKQDCVLCTIKLTFLYFTCAEKPRYAETWDFEVSGSSFLQFELSMGCSKSTSFSHGVRLEYTTDCGRHWSLITPECVPPAIGCAGYTQSSIYTSTQYKHWRRITVYLPSAAKYVFPF